jgi:predicted PurR-regulated permease PerM
LNSKRQTIVFLSALVLLVLVLAIVITWHFLRPFAFAVILAVVFYPLHQHMLRFTKGRTGTASLLSTLAVILVFGVPAFTITTIGANEAFGAAHYLSRRSAEEGGFTAFATRVLSGPVSYVGHWIDLSKFDIHAIVTSNVQKISLGMVGFGAAVFSNLARLTVDALITFVILFFLFREGKQWAYRAGKIMPISDDRVGRLYQNISDTIIANVYGILTVGVVQGILTGIAMKIVGMPSAMLLGLGAGFASIIPVVGSSIVWGPVAIYLFVQGAMWKAVFLLVWGTVVVSSMDNILRPWVVGGRVELHPMVLLFFILGGVEAFGFLGLFLGPVVASVLAAVFGMLREELTEPAPTTASAVIAKLE